MWWSLCFHNNRCNRFISVSSLFCQILNCSSPWPRLVPSLLSRWLRRTWDLRKLIVNSCFMRWVGYPTCLSADVEFVIIRGPSPCAYLYYYYSNLSNCWVKKLLAGKYIPTIFGYIIHMLFSPSLSVVLRRSALLCGLLGFGLTSLTPHLEQL